MHFYCCSSWDFLQSHYTVLLSAFLFFFLFHAPLDVISHLLVFLRSILRGRSFLSHFCPFVAQIKLFSAVTQGSLFWWCLPRISVAVSVTAVLKTVIIDGERCKLPAYHSLEGFQHTGIFQLSEVKLRLVRFGLLILFRRRWKVIISKSWSLPMCSGNVHSWSEALPH